MPRFGVFVILVLTLLLHINSPTVSYIVTARHIVNNIGLTDVIKLYRDEKWQIIPTTLVGHCSNDIDITVLSTNTQLSPPFPLEPTMESITHGQDVYFLGFPYGMYGEVDQLKIDFPIPFVKKAILSCMHLDNNGTQYFFLDGHNNPGFSGGPVVFREPNTLGDLKVMAVVSGYKYTNEPIYNSDAVLPLVYRYNTGIVICYGIYHAVELISKNPIGFLLAN